MGSGEVVCEVSIFFYIASEAPDVLAIDSLCNVTVVLDRNATTQSSGAFLDKRFGRSRRFPDTLLVGPKEVPSPLGYSVAIQKGDEWAHLGQVCDQESSYTPTKESGDDLLLTRDRLGFVVSGNDHDPSVVHKDVPRCFGCILAPDGQNLYTSCWHVVGVDQNEQRGQELL